jgi:hypothetical protein
MYSQYTYSAVSFRLFSAYLQLYSAYSAIMQSAYIFNDLCNAAHLWQCTVLFSVFSVCVKNAHSLSICKVSFCIFKGGSQKNVETDFSSRHWWSRERDLEPTWNIFLYWPSLTQKNVSMYYILIMYMWNVHQIKISWQIQICIWYKFWVETMGSGGYDWW